MPVSKSGLYRQEMSAAAALDFMYFPFYAVNIRRINALFRYCLIESGFRVFIAILN